MANQHPRFSKEELKFLQDEDIWRIKERVGKKTYTLLEELRDALDDFQPKIKETSSNLEEDINIAAPKISKGENYKGKPYMVLDMPRIFQTSGFLMFRTMVLWGTGFGFHLIANGVWAQALSESFGDHQESFHHSTYFCLGESPWEWEFEKINYLPIKLLTKEKLKEQFNEHEFLKLSVFYPMEELDSMRKLGIEVWQPYLKLLNTMPY